MGGVKRKSMAAMEKSQSSQDEAQQPGQEKTKKTKDQKTGPQQQQQQKRLPFLIPKMADDDMVKALAPIKGITVLSASRALGVNSSIANGVLRNLEHKKLLVRVGGFSGHYVWAVH